LNEGLAMNIQNQLFNDLNNSRCEKDVENAYRACFSRIFGSGHLSSEYKTDGILNYADVHAILEFKYNLELNTRSGISQALIQIIYYLHNMAECGASIPKVIFVGDINECFCMPMKDVAKYLKYDCDWSIAPSQAYKKNIQMYQDIIDDKNIYPFIYDIDLTFDMTRVIDKMKAINLNMPYSVTITKKNIVEIFEKFNKDIIKGAGDDAVKIFFDCLLDSDNCFIHPNKKNYLVADGKAYKINEAAFRAFFSQFRNNYTPKEKDDLAACKDRVLEDVHRRMTGAFFTPPIFADKAHEYIARTFGDNWRDEYVVYDMAAGTGNLTRDYNFREPYLSTLEQHDVDIINKMGYNKGATIFQYDFLNDGTEDLPEGLLKALREQKKIIIIANPPYGTANNIDAGSSEHKADIALTKTNSEMKADNVGSASQQLYAQFMYRLAKLQDQFGGEVNICTFAPPLFMSGASGKSFRKFLFDRYHFESGMLFQASHFADVKGQWGISFTVWQKGQEERSEFPLDIIELEDFELKNNGTKIVYSTQASCLEWVRESVLGLKKNDSPQMAAATNVTQKGKGFAAINSIGHFHDNTNKVCDNSTQISLFSSCCADGHSISILPINFNRCIALFCARKSITPNWINCKDEYMVPNTDHPDYEQWNNDCLIYSLFNNSSQQSSLRQIDYKDKKWNIFNNFFFMSNADMLDLANENNFVEMYQDCKQFNEDRYVYNLLQTTPLSDDATNVLNMAVALIKKSFKMRVTYHDEHPEYHLASWDAGWAQMKPMFKEFFKEDYTAFVKEYKRFEDRMREGVYKFGFLK